MGQSAPLRGAQRPRVPRLTRAGPPGSFTLIFGSLVDTLGSGKSMSQVLEPIILYFLYLGSGAAVAGFFEIACFELTGVRTGGAHLGRTLEARKNRTRCGTETG